MVEYERLFSQAVQLKLKSIIKGKIFVCVTYSDELLVKIYRDGNVVFQTTIPSVTTKLRDGLSSGIVVKKIVEEYRQDLYEKFEKQYFY